MAENGLDGVEECIVLNLFLNFFSCTPCEVDETLFFVGRRRSA